MFAYKNCISEVNRVSQYIISSLPSPRMTVAVAIASYLAVQPKGLSATGSALLAPHSGCGWCAVFGLI